MDKPKENVVDGSSEHLSQSKAAPIESTSAAVPGSLNQAAIQASSRPQEAIPGGASGEQSQGTIAATVPAEQPLKKAKVTEAQSNSTEVRTPEPNARAANATSQLRSGQPQSQEPRASTSKLPLPMLGAVLPVKWQDETERKKSHLAPEENTVSILCSFVG